MAWGVRLWPISAGRVRLLARGRPLLRSASVRRPPEPAESSTQSGWGLDNVRIDVTPIPEPSTFFLLGTGFAGLLGLGLTIRRAN